MVLVLVVAVLRVVFWWNHVHSIGSCIGNQDRELVVQVVQVLQDKPGVKVVQAQVLQHRPFGCASLIGHHIKLSWYTSRGARLGEELAFIARLRAPWGSSNAGTFNYEKWLLSKGYVASGYVRQWLPPTAAGALLSPTQHRQRFSGYVYQGLLHALSTGDRHLVAQQEWTLLRQTGTIHLAVISGLHVGIFAGVLYFVSLNLCRFCLLILPHQWVALFHLVTLQKVAITASFIGTWGIVFLTGAQAPVLRAALMTTLAGLLLLAGAGPVFWLRALLLCATTCVLIMPRLVLQQGFWLSYLAVYILLFGLSCWGRPRTAVRLHVTSQLLLFVCLSPWLATIVGDVPLISPLANLIAVPLISIVTMPAILCGHMSQPWMSLSGVCFALADYSLWVLMAYLKTLVAHTAQFPLVGYFHWPATIAAVTAAHIMFVPANLKSRFSALCIWLGCLLPNSNAIKGNGDFTVHVLDVGQGSSAIIDTSHHRMIVDVGPAYRDGFNAARDIVMPVLRYTGNGKFNATLITHMDRDHAGGLDIIKDAIGQDSVRQVKIIGEKDCGQLSAWSWDGVQFRIIYDPHAVTSNDRSCTLLVTGRDQTAYFSGDISKSTEYRLLRRLPHNINLLIAPHHGSSGSSGWQFVHQLAPDVAIFSSGRYNRYGHPRGVVIARYEVTGTRTFNTAKVGAITWRSVAPKQLLTNRLGHIDLEMN